MTKNPSSADAMITKNMYNHVAKNVIYYSCMWRLTNADKLEL